MLWGCLWLVTTLAVNVESVLDSNDVNGRICRSIDVRNSVDALRRLSGCRVVEGFVRVVLIDRANDSDYDHIVFPELREITDYLLVYRVKGLRSLGSLFPNLTVIRGNTLFVDYALVVFEMFELLDLGLSSLTTILRGSVRIERNEALCYVDTVDWSAILAGGGKLMASSNSLIPCPLCRNCQHCWGPTSCQHYPQDDHCHPLCLGGCSGPSASQCAACRHVSLDQECVRRCPQDRFTFMGRRCVTEEECRSSEVPPAYLQRGEPSSAWIPFNGSCILTCPLDHQIVTRNDGKNTCEPCEGHCRKVCGSGGVFPIQSMFDIQNLHDCTFINGSLVIHLLHGSDVAEEMEISFQEIEEISGFLKITRSYSLVSLRFLSRLKVIHGRQLEGDRFALVITENENLQELWRWNSTAQNLTIHRGTLAIHSNPQLCVSEIDKLREVTGLLNDSEVEISQESNGNKRACNLFVLNTTYVIINSTAVSIQWDHFQPPQGLKTLLGYTVHYMESPGTDTTLNTDIDRCEVDHWKVVYVMLTAPSKKLHMNYVITRLKPFTQYAYYVETYSTAAVREAGRSIIEYFKTFPDRPSIPRFLRAYPNSSSEVVLHWKPPLFPNGEISHYIIVLWLHEEDSSIFEQRDYCRLPLEYEEDTKVDYRPLQSQFPTNSCCKAESRKECISNDESKFNFIYTQEAVNEENHSCDHQTSIYNVLYSHRLYGNGGGIADDVQDGRFQQRTEGNATTAVVRNLRHFTEYTIKVVACRKDKYGEIDHEWNDEHCSPASLISTRTLKMDSADYIKPTSISIHVEGETARISWIEPSDPNGIMLTYHVEYKRTDIKNFVPITSCITKTQFEESGYWFVLSNLTAGNYSVRIMGTSLAGSGKFTSFTTFRIRAPLLSLGEQTQLSVLAVLGITVLVLLLCISIYLFGRWEGEKIPDSPLIASSNPQYLSISSYEPDEWEVVRDKVEMIRELGRGSFGVVYEGILWPANIPCAVKTVDETATVQQRIEFLKEASVMKSFAAGHHVLKLLGVVSRGQPPLVVMELMPRGDLKTFLRQIRTEAPLPVDSTRMLLMAAQIADGMAYLEASKFVHRDLAARNCMLTEDLIVKIGDFGMTRDIYDSDYYRKQNQGMLPVRWMAPESLEDGVFSTESDVWSYGVVLWEITTLAEQPYQGMSNEQVFRYVTKGNILDRPQCCPPILFSLMLACWQRKPSYRPSFLRIIRVLDIITDLGEDFQQISFYHSQEGQQLRSAWCQDRRRSSVKENTVGSCPEICETCTRFDSSLIYDGNMEDRRPRSGTCIPEINLFTQSLSNEQTNCKVDGYMAMSGKGTYNEGSAEPGQSTVTLRRE